MTRKHHKFEIDIPIWKMAFHIWICDHKTAQDWYEDTCYNEEDGSHIFKKWHAKTLSANGINPIVWVDISYSKNDLIAALAHESLHAIAIQFRDKGSYFDPDNHEHFTYLLEYCMKESLNKIYPLKKK